VTGRPGAWRWLSKAAVLAIYAEQLTEHGGAPGLREEHLLASALARPENLAAYGEPDAAALAAAYAFGIVRNHPFVDGNKRTGLVAAATFLLLNDLDLSAPEQEVVTTFWRLADGSLPEDGLAAWLRSVTHRTG
jgi:death on curing protein